LPVWQARTDVKLCCDRCALDARDPFSEHVPTDYGTKASTTCYHETPRFRRSAHRLATMPLFINKRWKPISTSSGEAPGPPAGRRAARSRGFRAARTVVYAFNNWLKAPILPDISAMIAEGASVALDLPLATFAHAPAVAVAAPRRQQKLGESIRRSQRGASC